MRIVVAQRALGQQRADLEQRLDDRDIGIARLALLGIDAPPREGRHLRQVDAGVVDHVRHRQAMGAPELEIVAPMAGRDMHDARARVGRDEAAGHDGHVEFVAIGVLALAPLPAAEGMGAARADQIGPGEGGDRLELRALELRLDLADEVGGDHQMLAGARQRTLRRLGDAAQPVGDLGAHGEAAIGGHRPGGCRPDDDRRADEPGNRALQDRETHPDGVRFVLVIFDLGLGQRGLLDHRPHHRPRAAIEPAIEREAMDLAHDLRLGREGHGRIGIRPVAFDPQTLELGALDVDPFRGEVATLLAELDDRHRVLVLALGCASPGRRGGVGPARPAGLACRSPLARCCALAAASLFARQRVVDQHGA